ncbi:MAG: glycosyltransferase family 2 protein [Melioribacteraceae bacterium]|nr:glycosyltransferase family 2 protein [Melioribacteraceae bacterium]
MSEENQKDDSQHRKPRRRYYSRNRYYKKKNVPDQAQSDKFSFRKISILIPLLNEEESIEPLYNEIKKSLTKIDSDYEILFIDDGSSDRSLEIIKKLQSINNKIRYISFKKNYGKSAALQVGFKSCRGDAVITMDADLQDDPAEIPNLLKKLDEGFDLVSGWKKNRQDPFIKKHTSKLFNYATRLFSGIKIHDFNCGLKAYRSDVIKRVNVYGELHRYVPVLAKWEGFSVTEIPVKHHPRRYGKTKFGISRFFKGFVDLITVVFTTRYVKRPMHLFGFLGALAFFLGIVVNAYLTWEWFNGVPLKDRPVLFLGILLIIVGVQFFAVGLLGELIAHNFHDDKEYNIKEKK